jgi:hypothetical protein
VPLFILTIPLMALAVAAAVIPLIVVSHREHRHQRAEFATAGSRRASHAGALPRGNADVKSREAREAASSPAA